MISAPRETNTSITVRVASTTCGSTDHVGPMARSVADAAIMFEAIAGADPNDQTCLNKPVPNIINKLNGNIKGVRIGFDRKYSTENVLCLRYPTFLLIQIEAYL